MDYYKWRIISDAEILLNGDTLKVADTTAPAQVNSDGKRTHRATYAADKRNGGFNIRVVGPNANEFAGETVPVETKNGEEHQEKLVRLLWAGDDTDPQTKELTGRKAALYSFEARPREIVKAKF
jgi:hypothetical protein